MNVGKFNDSFDCDRTYSSHFASLKSGIARGGACLGLLLLVLRKAGLTRGLGGFPLPTMWEADTSVARLAWG